MKLICFCGNESEQAHGALYCRNPECPEYMNIVESTALSTEQTDTECTDDSIPFHDYNCNHCINKK